LAQQPSLVEASQHALALEQQASFFPQQSLAAGFSSAATPEKRRPAVKKTAGNNRMSIVHLE
jgi:hypothetical protein